MNLTERAVLDLAERWYHRCLEPGGDSFTDLYQAISAWKNEPCGALSTMWDDLQAQVDAEAKTRAERGEYLIDVDLDTGRVDAWGCRVRKPVRYLESNAP